MRNESKIYIFRDRPDYIKKITNDDIFNITGEKGSGKSFFGNMKDEENNCVVVHLDSVFIPSGSREHNYSKEVRNLLIEKFGEDLRPDISFEKDYYNEIINYIKNKRKTGYIEGGSIAEISDISNIVGTIVVKRTGVLKCFFRTIKRDYHNNYFMEQEIKLHGKFAKITRLYKVIKRRKKILKSYHSIEQFIEKLEKYERSIL